MRTANLSLRWRLALSFAGIALLATLALGAVLLTTVRGYYAREERAYLARNAEALRNVMMLPPFSDTDVLTSTMASQLQSVAFLSQSRARLFDASDNLLFDSGPPGDLRYVSTLSFAASSEENTPDVIWSMQPSSGIVISRRAGSFRVEPDASDTGSTVSTTNLIVSETPVSSTGQALSSVVIERDEPVTVSRFALPAVGTIYGFSFDASTPSEGLRSGQSVRRSILTSDGDLFGYLELSEGPAYGTQIVHSVAAAWGIATIIASVLAAGTGWWASRAISAPLVVLNGATARMAEGDLGTRAPASQRADEIGSLARSFNRMADRVEGTVSALRRFVTDAAHELHTPITALRTNLDLAAEDGEDRERALVRARQQVRRLEALTQGLLELARSEGALSAEMTTVDLRRVIRDLSEIYASRAEQADLAFELNVPAAPSYVLGSEQLLCRALTALLDNAVKFTPAGGRIGVTLVSERASVQVRIEDTGIGIPVEDMPYLFERFHRGRNVENYPGSGLGLAIAQAVIRGHGGDVIATRLPVGTRFTITLPADTDSSSPARAPSPARPAA